MAGALLGTPMARTHMTDLLEYGIRDVFFNEYENRNKEWQQIYTIKSSKKQKENDVVFAGLGQFFQKQEGDAPQFDSGQEAWKKVYTHNTWALGVEFTEEAAEDDLYDVMGRWGKELGASAAYTQSVQAMSPFNDLTATIYTAAGSNFTLLSTSQFLVTGATWSNRPTTAVDLSIESLEALLTQWSTGMVDQRNRKLATSPKYLMVGPSDQHIARRIVNSTSRPFTADNDVNTIRDWNLEVIVMHHMTDDGRWFLLGEKSETGLRYNERVPLQMRKRDDPQSGNMLYVARYRESHGLTFVSNLAGSP
jgi:hypothetical protein